MYDARSGWTYQLARWRSGFRFTSMDTYAGDSQDPLSLHKYLYVNADPVNGWDPSGQMLGMLGGLGIGEYAEASEGGAAIGFANIAMNSLKPLIVGYNGMMGGFVNATESGGNWAGSFMVGFVSASISSGMQLFAGLSSNLAAGVGDAILSIGNAYLRNGTTSWDDLVDAVIAGVETGILATLGKGSSGAGKSGMSGPSVHAISSRKGKFKGAKALDQLKGILKKQKQIRGGKAKGIIDDTTKSEKGLKNALKSIKNLADAIEDFFE